MKVKGWPDWAQTFSLGRYETHVSLFSGAGHDAQSLAGVCPVGIIFVPSVGGASHSPREFTRWVNCVNGANVLLQAALRMALF